jgi:hypothetical protein
VGATVGLEVDVVVGRRVGEGAWCMVVASVVWVEVCRIFCEDNGVGGKLVAVHHRVVVY